MKKFKVGLQLFSIRNAMEQDMDAALKAVKEMGYDYVEFAGYFGKSAEEVKAILDKYGLECISVHQAPSLFWEEGQSAIDYLKGIGAKYCAIPWYTVDEFFNNWDETMAKFTDLGKQLKENGIQLMYHNHDFEFRTIDGEFILDKMYATIPNDILKPQFDTCWVHYAGNNPAEYLKKYVGKIDNIYRIIAEDMETSMSIEDAVQLAGRILDIGGDKITTLTMPNTPQYIGGVSYVIPDYDGISSVRREYFAYDSLGNDVERAIQE